MLQEYKYFAFISYSSHDTEWGKKLQKKLEGYRMSSTLRKEYKCKRRPINPVFFAPSDIQPGGLTTELQARLRSSRNLIVICSPHSANSEWVGREIAFFHSLGRSENIYFFIIDGIPHSGNLKTECFHPVIHELGLPEILGANINEKIYRWSWLNKERAYVQLITKLLGIEFDTLWKRHRRLLYQKIMACGVGTIAFLSALLLTWGLNQPVNVNLSLHEKGAINNVLPPLKDAFVVMEVGREVKKDTIRDITDKAMFLHIPHKYLNKNVRVKITCKDYIDVDTTMLLSKSLSINMNRKTSIYGNVHFRLWNVDKEHTVPNCIVYIDGNEVISDNYGKVSVIIPISSQKTQYKIESSQIHLLDSIIYMPCGADDVICLTDKKQ
ncbi:toll/interleukin-1 receptor domain-containing protein [Phocaeicola plebeius]|uniref:toll/interleukin-1 receptor domain-containing protein n=1 Tax=Phocaeicola plebeius TaxID=310297 RepID=UPI00307F9163